MTQTLEQLIEKYGEAAVLSAASDVKHDAKVAKDKNKHYCPVCESTNIYRLERPVKYHSKKMTKLRCKSKKCGFKWTRYEYQNGA